MNVLGEVVAGELESNRLEPVVSTDHFWFSWTAFRPKSLFCKVHTALASRLIMSRIIATSMSVSLV